MVCTANYGNPLCGSVFPGSVVAYDSGVNFNGMQLTGMLLGLCLLLAAGCQSSDTTGENTQATDVELDTLNASTEDLERSITSEITEDPILWNDGRYRAVVDYLQQPNGKHEQKLIEADLVGGAVTALHEIASGKLISRNFDPAKIDALGATVIRLPTGEIYRLQLEDNFVEDSLEQ